MFDRKEYETDGVKVSHSLLGKRTQSQYALGLATATSFAIAVMQLPFEKPLPRVFIFP